MWPSHHCFSESMTSHWQHITIAGDHYQMESILLFDSCWLPFNLIVKKYLCSIWFIIWLNTAKGSKSECLHTSMMTSHIGVMGVTQQFVRTESECLYTCAMTRYVQMKGEIWQSVYQLSCFTPIATCMLQNCHLITLNKLSLLSNLNQFYSLYLLILHYWINICYSLQPNDIQYRTEFPFPFSQSLMGTWESEVFNITSFMWHMLSR
jgi:hypothetical protein